jgi:hypothetical protein
MTETALDGGLVALADRLELWPIERLRPYDRNPRTHSNDQIAKIAASMVEFGWTNPILIDETDGILAGHGRLQAAKHLGLSEVPVVQLAHLSEAQKHAYVIADNQLALQAGHVPVDVEMRGRRCLPGAYALGANLQTGQRRFSRIGITNEERKRRRWRW